MAWFWTRRVNRPHKNAPLKPLEKIPEGFAEKPTGQSVAVKHAGSV